MFSLSQGRSGADGARGAPGETGTKVGFYFFMGKGNYHGRRIAAEGNQTSLPRTSPEEEEVEEVEVLENEDGDEAVQLIGVLCSLARSLAEKESVNTYLQGKAFARTLAVNAELQDG